jgi:hypothetical protein
VVKIPDSAGSAGNIVLEPATVRYSPLSKICGQVLSLIQARGWDSEFTLLVGAWACEVLTSLPALIRVPLAAQGSPVIEVLLEQLVRGAEGEFIGATTAELPAQLRQRRATEAMQLACLFPRLVYFGPCSFDVIIVADEWYSAAVHWIGCNRHWRGTSIPMTLVNRLIGNRAQRAIIIVQCVDLEMRR